MLEFHFLRPWWLAMLPVGLWLAWRLMRVGGLAGRWRGVVDQALQPFVLAGIGAGLVERRSILAAAATAWLLATLALAGPTWERQPVPAVRSDEALVIILDLSRSMDAADVAPSRLARAKLKLLDLLEMRRSGQTGLVVFSAHAFTVAPLTTDTRNIASLITALSTNIMPSRGSYPEAGLRKGAQLLEQVGVRRGELLLITDSESNTVAEDVASELYDQGYAIHVLAVGTADGAPIALDGGGFLTDRDERVVVPQLDIASLRRLATLGGGRFAVLTPDDRDLNTILGVDSERAGDVIRPAADDERYQSDLWRDQGLWLTLLLLPLIALSFRRGWIVVWLVALALPSPRAEALEWADFWLTPDQRGQRAFEADDPGRAAELFDDPEWLAAARYRAGDFAGSAEVLDGIESAEAHYNRGNALARAGEIGAAIQAYTDALELDADHEDALYNRDLLQRQEPPPQSQQQQGDSQQQDSENSDDQEQQQQGEQPSDQEQPDTLQPMSPDEAQATASAQSQTENDNEQPPQPEEFEPLPTPGELEEWAEEQAADQWLRRIPEDPGGLLRRKCLVQSPRMGTDQDGNYIWPGDEAEPW
jgi:Ca-activated chloride channel family protein